MYAAQNKQKIELQQRENKSESQTIRERNHWSRRELDLGQRF